MVSEHDTLVRQNWGFLSPQDQVAIGKSRVLLAGCGLGSNIAVLAARTGFAHFILADGDRVELSNLNRQAFRQEHVGQNKAQVTAALVHEVNPHAKVQVVPAFLRADDAVPLVEQCDVVVNLVDPGPPLDALLRAAKKQGKFTLFPLNIGFGGVLLTFGPHSPTPQELLGSATETNLFVSIVERLIFSLPSYLMQYAWVAERVRREGVPPPQLGVAASLTAALVVRGLVGVALGAPPPVVPAVLALDSKEPSVISWPVQSPNPGLTR